jgi:quercetin dioxygenase-like cupin family protein
MQDHQTVRTYWPPEITSLPSIEFHVAGVTGHTMKNHEKQVAFFHFEEGTVVPDHSHGAQWGYLVSGEMTLELDGRSELFQAGDVYYIPAGKKHRTSFSRASFVIDMGDDPGRFRVSD